MNHNTVQYTVHHISVLVYSSRVFFRTSCLTFESSGVEIYFWSFRFGTRYPVLTFLHGPGLGRL